MGRLIVFEGLDCTGKTSVAKRLVEKLELKNKNVEYNKTPDTWISRRFRSGVTYLMDYILDEYKHIRPKLKDDQAIVIQDRYYFSVLAYNAAMTGTKKFNFASFMFSKPTYVFYLCADDETRQQRWAKSGKKGFSETFRDFVLAHRIEDEYKQLLSSFNKRILDTTHNSVDEIVDDIIFTNNL